MPYPNEHSCRLEDPSLFQKDSFRRTTRKHNGKEYDIIMGKKKNSTKMSEQAYRYDKEKWTEEEAQNHCKEHNGKFEKAKDKNIKEAEGSSKIQWEYVTPITQEDIEYAEKETGLTLPKDYVKLVLKYNGGRPDPGFLYQGETIYGIVSQFTTLDKKDPSNLVVMYNLISKDPRRTDNVILLPFADDPGGNLFCFMYKNKKDTQPSIVFYDHETGDIEYTIASNFTEFINMLQEEIPEDPFYRFIYDNKNEFHFIGSPNYHEVQEAEEKLGMKFPPILFDILWKYGAFSYRNVEIFGIGMDVGAHNNIVSRNLELRKEQTFPKKLIAFQELGNEIFALCDSRGRVFKWSPKYNGKIQKTRLKLKEYLLQQLQNAKNNKMENQMQIKENYADTINQVLDALDYSDKKVLAQAFDYIKEHAYEKEDMKNNLDYMIEIGMGLDKREQDMENYCLYHSYKFFNTLEKDRVREATKKNNWLLSHALLILFYRMPNTEAVYNLYQRVLDAYNSMSVVSFVTFLLSTSVSIYYMGFSIIPIVMGFVAVAIVSWFRNVDVEKRIKNPSIYDNTTKRIKKGKDKMKGLSLSEQKILVENVRDLYKWIKKVREKTDSPEAREFFKEVMSFNYDEDGIEKAFELLQEKFPDILENRQDRLAKDPVRRSKKMYHYCLYHLDKNKSYDNTNKKKIAYILAVNFMYIFLIHDDENVAIISEVEFKAQIKEILTAKSRLSLLAALASFITGFVFVVFGVGFLSTVGAAASILFFIISSVLSIANIIKDKKDVMIPEEMD